jgi:hypothetical protein
MPKLEPLTGDTMNWEEGTPLPKAVDDRITRAYQAFDKLIDAFDPPLNHVQRCMLLNALFEMQRIERDHYALLAEQHTGLWDEATALNIAASIRNPNHTA